MTRIDRIGACVLVAIMFAVLPIGMVAMPARAHARTSVCASEDSPSWDWTRCGNHRRGVVTMWGTPKVVTCSQMRWLIRHDDLDLTSTPVLRGDRKCGRR